MFAYCNNNPVTFFDPAGNFPWIIIPFIIPFVLVGCSYGDTGSGTATAPEGAPPDYIPSNNPDQNCYGFVTGHESSSTPGRYSTPIPGDEITYLYADSPTPSVDVLLYLTLRDMAAWGWNARPVNDPSEKLDGEFIIAMNIGTKPVPGVGLADYHFAIQLSDGTWADKRGGQASNWNAIDGTAAVWDRRPGDGYYNAGTRYVAVSKRGN